MDLGLKQAWAPGSTAKVMSALAGLKKRGVVAANPNNRDYSYFVSQSQVVGDEPKGNVNMQRAIVESSNCYFIHLVNTYDLYDNLSYIYRTIGAEINMIKPYDLFYSDSTNVGKFYKSFNSYDIEGAKAEYKKYIENKDKTQMYDSKSIWQWAWGQGDLATTPLSMARVASIVGNNGVMASTRYTKDDKGNKISVVSSAEANALGRFMEEEAETHMDHALISSDNNIIGGKTGTAHRDVGKKRSMDAWYICYVKPKSSKNTIAIAVRIERGGSSVNAKKMVKKVVLPILEPSTKIHEKAYINEL